MASITVYLSSPIMCYLCHIPFAMPDDMLAARKRDHRKFWCPNGHEQAYVGKTDAEKLADTQRALEIERRARQRAETKAAEANKRLEAEAEARRAAVAKGNRTKAQKRATQLDKQVQNSSGADTEGPHPQG